MFLCALQERTTTNALATLTHSGDATARMSYEEYITSEQERAYNRQEVRLCQ